MRLPLNSLRFKISVLSILILAAILIIYSAFLFMTFRMMMYHDVDHALIAKGEKISNAITSYLDVLGNDSKSFEFSVNRVIAQRGEHPHQNKIEKLENLWLGQAAPLGINQDYVEFLDPTGTLIVKSRNFPPGKAISIAQADRENLVHGQLVFKDIELDKEKLRLMLIPAFYPKVSRMNPSILAIATSRERIVEVLKKRIITKVILISLILIFASFLSQIFVQRVLKPILEITKMARSINYKDLNKRISTEKIDEEMLDLVNALNDMMSRLQKSFQYIAEFSSHVSHELKTPLAIMRGEAELALRGSHTSEEYRAVLKGNLDEMANMSRIIEDMLLLTKLDYQPDIYHLEDMNLTKFVEELEEPVRMLAEEKNIKTTFELPKKPVLISGDRIHLRRLFLNIINNAIKFTYAGGTIQVRMHPEGKVVSVAFIDTGIGIPEENLHKIFEKFFHFNGIAVDVPTGNGLGLSIAQAIAKIHAGNISVKSRLNEGSTFTLYLPIKSF